MTSLSKSLKKAVRKPFGRSNENQRSLRMLGKGIPLRKSRAPATQCRYVDFTNAFDELNDGRGQYVIYTQACGEIAFIKTALAKSVPDRLLRATRLHLTAAPACLG